VLAGKLIEWFRGNARDLPWRRPECSAWGVLVSEVMLQQTPVVRVAPVWQEWLRRWPLPSDLAAVSPADVLRAWGRLGYPRRALRLHSCAGVLTARHGNTVPADVTLLLALPGVGAYTARAVACFAYGQRVAVVDTNVRRVIARAVHGRARPAGASTTRDLADAAILLPADAAQVVVVSAALMELGALVCTARAPRCGQCPIRVDCAWVRQSSPPDTAPRGNPQRFAGTDRQVRGLLMEVLRNSFDPVAPAQLDLVWVSDPLQRDRALGSLLRDGLVEQTAEGLFALPGEGAAAQRKPR